MIKQAVIARMGLAIISRASRSTAFRWSARGFWSSARNAAAAGEEGLRDYIIDEICLGIDQFGLQHSVARPGGA